MSRVGSHGSDVTGRMSKVLECPSNDLPNSYTLSTVKSSLLEQPRPQERPAAPTSLRIPLFDSSSTMQRVLSIAPVAPMSVRVAPRALKARGRVAMKVASLDSVASQMEAAGVDKEDAYRRFEELLGSADVSFNQGDRVRQRNFCRGHMRCATCFFAVGIAPQGISSFNSCQMCMFVTARGPICRRSRR